MKPLGLLTIWLMLLAAVPAQSGEPPRRIVSLAPNLTELVCSLGLEKSLVGVTSYCDRPASVKGKPTVGGPANPSLEAVLRLKPDLVVVDEEGVGVNLSKKLHKLGIKTFVFHGSRLDRLVPAIRQLGNELGVPQAAERLASRIEGGLHADKGRTEQIRTLFVIWPDPLVAAGPGSLLDDVMQRVGFANIAEDARSGYPRLSLEAAIARNPQLIVVGQGDKLAAPTQRMFKHLSSLEAVRQGRACMVSDALYRPGPRIPEGIAELKQCRDQLHRGKRP